MSKKMQFVPKRKLTGRDIMGEDVRKIWKEFIKTNPEMESLELYQIGGVVNRFEMTENDFGESAKLLGDFIGINKKTGEAFRSNRAYLPTIVSEYITGALASAAVGSTVQFAFNITAIGDEKSATGYVYTYENLMDGGESDLMLGIAAKMGMDEKLLEQRWENRTAKALEDKSEGKKRK